jgi:hypothetical protein
VQPDEERGTHEKGEKACCGGQAVERVRYVFVKPEAEHNTDADAESNITLEAGHLGTFQAEPGQRARRKGV